MDAIRAVVRVRYREKKNLIEPKPLTSSAAVGQADAATDTATATDMVESVVGAIVGEGVGAGDDAYQLVTLTANFWSWMEQCEPTEQAK